MQIRLQVTLEHPVAYLSDPYAEGNAPPDTGEAPVTFTDDCIALQVGSYLDGGADIIVGTAGPPHGRAPDFRLPVNCESGTLSVSDSHRFNYCMVPIEGTAAEVEIWLGKSEDGQVWIRISTIVEY